MKRSQPTGLLGGLLICGIGLGLPGTSYAVTGCANANLLGVYTANVANSNLLAVLNSINAPGTTPSSSTLLNSPFGPAGSSPYAAQFYFDGQGNIIDAGANRAGTFSVSTDCSATMSFANGTTFNAVLVGGGAGVLLMQNNAGSGGPVGTLQRAASTCITNSPQSLGFSYFGAQKTADGVNPVSAVGQLQLNGQGGFVMQEWLYQYGKTTALNLSGTYTVTPNCSLSLNFAPPTSANSVTIPLSGTISAATGTFIPQ